MQYPKIIALIDARIALLRQVRDALSASPKEAQAPAPRPARRQSPGVAQKEPEGIDISAASPEITPKQPPHPEPVRLPFVAPRQRPSVTKRAVSLDAHSALSGQHPQGPVFVSAARVKEEEAQRRDVERKPLPTSEAAPAELNDIRRRWLQEQQARTA